MRNDRVLLLLVIADIVLVMLTIGAEVALHTTLPEPLRAYAGWGAWSWADVVRLPLWLVIVLTTFVSWFGLLKYWWPARILYIGAWIGWILLIATSGPGAMTGVGSAIDRLEHVVGGMIISLVCFSDLRKRFEEDDEVRTVAARA
jgi:hypothetical protein